MESTPYSSSTSASWKMPDNANITANNASNFWSNGGFRKRKAGLTDLDERGNQKMFVTEEKMVKEMQTLSLELVPPDMSNMTIMNSAVNDELFVDEILPPTQIPFDDSNSIDDDVYDDQQKKTISDEVQIELHTLLKDSFRKDDLNDSLLKRLCDNERKKLTMQLVPYIPIHPAQLTTETVAKDNKTKEEEIEEKSIDNESSSSSISDEIKIGNDDHLFKIPFVPTVYTVEEPPGDAELKRAAAIKRSYSQSAQSNSSLLVTELKADTAEFSSISQSQPQPAYFILEPTANSLSHASTFSSSSSLSSDGPSVRISECVENPTPNNEFSNILDDDDIDMQSVASSDTGDKMDDD